MKNRTLAVLPLALLAGFSASAAHAQTSSASPAEASLKETVVTATRVEQALTDVVADITIVDRVTIDRSGATGIADMLARVPGVSISRNGGPGASTSVYLRGGETRFTAVYVDGVRIESQSTSGGASWNAIPLSQIDRIEVLRGPAAAVYGSDAIAGVIQIFTRQGQEGFFPWVEVGAGTYGTRKLDAGFVGGSGVWDYALGVTRETSTGFNAQPAGNPDRDGYRSKAVSAKLGLKLVPGHRLDMTLLSSKMDAQYDASNSRRDDHALSELTTSSLKWSAKWSDVYSTQVSVSEGTDRYETRPSPYLTKTRLSNYLWLNQWRLGEHNVTASLERREDKFANVDTTPPTTDRSQNAVALGYGWQTGKHSVQLNARHDRDSEFGAKSTGSAAYAYAFVPGWSLTTSAGSAFRVPTLYQRFSIYGVPSLKPETARNVEVGVKRDVGGSHFSVVAYRNKVSDLITYVGGPGSCINGVGARAGCYGNTARAEYSGVTVAADGKLGKFALHGSIDWQHPKDLDTGRELARRPREMAKLGVDTQVAGWTVGTEMELVGRRFNDAANRQRMAGYGLVNAYASKRVASDWTVLGRVDNLGDKTYQTARGYATAGLTVYVGLKWAPL
ncbi:TonB-dependent receptor domain-containing protein [Hydrogenophaga palleronii]|uniref:TonB-dependent receptor domain-containing protein n=1 Tax=Hydrogenophaga palleronii TaxID=65655 RepID=UPI000825C111|nr:TonB-dependent receptor [Hydrogenophaga palleronii]